VVVTAVAVAFLVGAFSVSRYLRAGMTNALVAVFRGLDLPELVVSESDILDGLVASIMPA
jgi:hypothetical protein